MEQHSFFLYNKNCPSIGVIDAILIPFTDTLSQTWLDSKTIDLPFKGSDPNDDFSEENSHSWIRQSEFDYSIGWGGGGGGVDQRRSGLRAMTFGTRK